MRAEVSQADRILKAVGSLWEEMLSHPFLREAATGQIPTETFHHWAAQDYQFVVGAIRFVGLLLIRTPDQETTDAFLDFLTGLREEVKLFRTYAQSHGFSLEVDPAPTNRAYQDFLIAVAQSGEFVEGFTALWCAEKAYYDSWSVVRKDLATDVPYYQFIENWTSEGFAEWVRWLESRWERLVADREPALLDRLQEIFRLTTKYEIQFWEMAYQGEG